MNEASQAAPTQVATVSAERRGELRDAAAANRAAGRPPFWRVRVQSRAEIEWIMHEQNWRGDLGRFQQDERVRNGEYIDTADFRETNFSGANLAGIALETADLRSANFIEANLSNAILVDADLSDAQLRHANLTGASLRHANLTGAHFREAQLIDADLTYAQLNDTRFPEANLSGASLYGAHMSEFTVLSKTTISATTKLGDVLWNNALLSRIDWSVMPCLGDEAYYFDKASSRREHIEAAHKSSRVYLGVAAVLKAQDLTKPAARFRLRALRLQRRAMLLSGNLPSWLGAAILDGVAGYGERPGRAFVGYIMVVLGFAAAYFSVASLVNVALSPLGALVFSITSFHGRGFFPGSLPAIDGPLTVLAATEAVIGLFIELIFIATFSRRFLGQ